MFFMTPAFDRAVALRRDGVRLKKLLGDPNTRIIPVWRDRNLVVSGDAPSAAMFAGGAAAALLEIAAEVVLLGVIDGTPYVAVDVSDHEDSALRPRIGDAGFADLREVGVLLEAGEASLLALARAMTYWHRRHRYCGDCGSPTASRFGGYSRLCGNPACAREHFPRTDPAVIMLVTRRGPGGGDCLLGRQASWPPGRYSTLAGFVEPGETLEHAVAREVMEETGIAVADVRYQASQPWPFPASLMLGFRARATADRIVLNDRELEDARWFSRAEMMRFEELGFHLPRLGSISRWLITGWVSEAEKPRPRAR